MTAFDPTAWLHGFEQAGGCYMTGSDGHIWLGYPIDGDTIEEACTLMRQLRIDAEANAAVKRAIRDRERQRRRYG